MTTDCSLHYKFNTWKFQAQTWGDHVVYRNCFWHSEQFLYTTCSPQVWAWNFMHWTCNSINNLSSYWASDKDLPVTKWIKGAKESKQYFMFVLVFIEVWKYNNLGKNSHDDKKLRIEPELLSAGRSTNVLASTSIQKPSCSLLKRVIRECLI